MEIWILIFIFLFFAFGPKIEGFTNWYPWYPYYIDPPYYTTSRYYLNNPNWSKPYRVPKWRKKFKKPSTIRYGPPPFYGYRYRKSLQNFP